MKKVYVLMNDYDGRMRTNLEPAGFAVTSKKEAKHYVKNYGNDACYYEMFVFEKLDEGFSYLNKKSKYEMRKQKKRHRLFLEEVANERAEQSKINQKTIKDEIEKDKLLRSIKIPKDPNKPDMFLMQLAKKSGVSDKDFNDFWQRICSQEAE